MFAYCNNTPVNGWDPDGSKMVNVVIEDEVIIHMPFFPNYFATAPRNSFPEALVSLLGKNTEISFSVNGGFCLMLEASISLVIDNNGTIAVVLTPGIGGGFGARVSLGAGPTLHPEIFDVQSLEGPSVKIGASFGRFSVEMDDKSSYSFSGWKKSKSYSADFHATINNSWVIIIWEDKDELLG